jgi:hypothetical protein
MAMTDGISTEDWDRVTALGFEQLRQLGFGPGLMGRRRLKDAASRNVEVPAGRRRTRRTNA